MTRGRRQVDWFVFNIGAPINTSRPLLALNVTARWVIFPRPIRLWTPPRSHFYFFPVCVCMCVICCVLSQQFFTFRILLILFLLLTKPRFNFPVVRPPNVSFLYFLRNSCFVCLSVQWLLTMTINRFSTCRKCFSLIFLPCHCNDIHSQE